MGYAPYALSGALYARVQLIVQGAKLGICFQAMHASLAHHFVANVRLQRDVLHAFLGIMFHLINVLHVAVIALSVHLLQVAPHAPQVTPWPAALAFFNFS